LTKAIELAELRDIAVSFCPELEKIIRHESRATSSTWESGIETGKSIELLSLCALTYSLRSTGHEVTLPRLYDTNPDLFYLRNVLPRHHGAQPGHDAVTHDYIGLKERFLAAMTPKMQIRDLNGREFLIYREGHPVHLIAWLAGGKTEYRDRPDILIAAGACDLDPAGSGELGFKYSHSFGTVSGNLRIRNDIDVPLISVAVEGETDVPIRTIIECSVGKGSRSAKQQLRRYMELYSNPERPKSVLVNGKAGSCSAYDFELSIDISSGNAERLHQQLSQGFKAVAAGIASSSIGA